MEGRSSSSSGANMLPSASYGFIDLQGSTQVHHAQDPKAYQATSMVTPHDVQDVFNLRVGNMRESNQTVSFLDYSNKGERRGKNSLSDDEEINYGEGINGHNGMGKGKNRTPWQRVKWTDKMVILLITAVSYIGEDASSASDYIIGGVRRKTCLLQKKGKWKTVSKVMAERGFYVSPQQCEDKFNDLNKRYKRLNDVLGRGTSCEVVENPALLDLMDLPEKAKEDVRKILSSKHLYYEQMCSYHNGNRLHLPHDLDLQRSLQLALRSKDDYEPPESRQHSKADDFYEEDQDVGETDDRDDDETEEEHALHMDDGTFGLPMSCSGKRMKGNDEVGFINSFEYLDCNKRSDGTTYVQNEQNLNRNLPEGSKSDWSRDQWMMCHSLQLEEKKLLIQEQMLELGIQQLKWKRFSRKQERELDKMRLENECIKLENERMGLELKRKEFNATLN